MRKILRQAAIVGWKPLVRRKILPHGSVIRVDIEGREIQVRARTPDLFVAIENLTNEYEFLDEHVPNDFRDIVVDAGGYIGTSAIKFSERFPESTVVSVEPDPKNFEMLVKNTKKFKNIVPKNAALAGTGGATVELKDFGLREWGYSVVDSEDVQVPSRVIGEVRTLSLSDIQNEIGGKIGFLKMDIEGAEKDIFDVADSTISVIPFVFVELHDRKVAGCTDSFRKFSRDRTIITFGGEKFLAVKA